MSSLPALARLEIYQMERCSGRLHLEMQKLKASDVESLAEIVPGYQISRHFRWCPVIWLVPRDFNCSNSSSIGKRAWLAHPPRSCQIEQLQFDRQWAVFLRLQGWKFIRWSAAQDGFIDKLDTLLESLAEIVPGWGHQISRHFRWCQVIWLVPRDFNCSNSSSIGKRVQAWLAHPPRSCQIEQLQFDRQWAVFLGLQGWKFIRWSAAQDGFIDKLDTLLTEFPCPMPWRLCWHRQV